MIKSMTAFGRVVASAKEGGFIVEIKSINHRFFDFSIKAPQSLLSLEAGIKELVKSKITRGKVYLMLSLEQDDKKTKPLVVDDEMVKFYLKSFKQVGEKHKVEGSLTLAELVKLPGVLTTEQAREDVEAQWTLIKKVIDKAIDVTLKSKNTEGKKLAADMSKRLREMTSVTKKVEKLAASRPKKVLKRLNERVEQLLGNRGLDSDRLYREAALIAEKCDMTEEVVRLKSHLQLFEDRLKQDEPVGRELDFLCQEINREINTMGSKAQLFEISREVVFLKGELEKIREQVQNVE